LAGPPLRHVIFDLDGVLFRGSEPTPWAADAVARLRQGGGRVAFLTNNSSRHRRDVAAHLRQLGIEADEDEVMTSGMAAALHIRQNWPGRTAYIIGERGLASELAEQGIAVAEKAADAGLIVVGWDRGLTFDKLMQAHQAIAAGAVFVATNRDSSYPLSDGRTCPGAGALVASLVTSTGLEPSCVGKPDPGGMRMIAERWGVEPCQVAAVGDRLETDIAAARAFGARAILVLTGIASRADAQSAPPAMAPDAIIGDLSGLAEALS